MTWTAIASVRAEEVEGGYRYPRKSHWILLAKFPFCHFPRAPMALSSRMSACVHLGPGQAILLFPRPQEYDTAWLHFRQLPVEIPEYHFDHLQREDEELLFELVVNVETLFAEGDVVLESGLDEETRTLPCRSSLVGKSC